MAETKQLNMATPQSILWPIGVHSPYASLGIGAVAMMSGEISWEKSLTAVLCGIYALSSLSFTSHLQGYATTFLDKEDEDFALYDNMPARRRIGLLILFSVVLFRDSLDERHIMEDAIGSLLPKYERKYQSVGEKEATRCLYRQIRSQMRSVLERRFLGRSE